MRRFIIRWILAHAGEDRDEVLRQAMKDLFLPINPDDILQIKDDKWYFMSRELRVDEVERLKNDAQVLRNMKLWSVLKWDVRYHLSKHMFEEGKVKEDFIWGQLATYLWDIIKTRVNQLGSLK